MSRKIKLGKKYRDTVSGFEGTAVAISEYLNGCIRVALMAKVDKPNAEPQELVFDEQQLELVKAPSKAPKELRRTGGARPSVPRTGLR